MTGRASAECNDEGGSEADEIKSKAPSLESTPDEGSGRESAGKELRPCIACGKAACSGCKRCTGCLSDRGDCECEGCQMAASVDDSEDASHKDLRCCCRRKTVCPGRRCTKCSKLNYTCPHTGKCIDPGAWDWLQGSAASHGRKLSNVDSRYAAVKDVFKLAFVADRISGGILSSNEVIEVWCRIVGANHGTWPTTPHYAD